MERIVRHLQQLPQCADTFKCTDDAQCSAQSLAAGIQRVVADWAQTRNGLTDEYNIGAMITALEGVDFASLIPPSCE